MDEVTRTEREPALFVMSVLMAFGALGLAVDVTELTVVPVDPLIVAYALFAVAFLAGAVHHSRVCNHVATAAHAVAVVGWLTGILAQTVAWPELMAFSLGTLGASGVALFVAGLQSVGVIDASV